ncbi:hypothetical protein F0Z19_1075 [Vibrio cyclitrophicus]|nr:hypothetical protein F0Z19_1075 [Vibrio cyclitrophicus]
MQAQIKRMNEVGNMVFLTPTPLLSYEALVLKSLGSNTYRGFHRKNNNCLGASHTFRDVLNEKKDYLIHALNNLTSEVELNTLANELCSELIVELSKNIIPLQLQSFNKVRKPVDIVFEHFVAMGEDFAPARKTATRWLFLPLDSQMFQSEFIFTAQEAKSLDIKRRFTYKDIKTAQHYAEIQNFLKDKATKIGLKHRIYFDLVWNKRFESNGTNLFLTNPSRK